VDDGAAVVREGIRIQRRTDAFVAALAALPPRQAESLLAWMIARRKVTVEEFEASLSGYRPRSACRRLGAYVPLVASKVASRAELLARSILVEHGITGWQSNVLVRTVDGAAKSADFLFAAARLIVMIDGWGYHGSRQAFQVDRQDQNGLIGAGYTVLRFTPEDLQRRPAYVVESVFQVLRWAGSPMGS
jgi:hypothetical protein